MGGRSFILRKELVFFTAPVEAAGPCHMPAAGVVHQFVLHQRQPPASVLRQALTHETIPTLPTVQTPASAIKLFLPTTALLTDPCDCVWPWV